MKGKGWGGNIFWDSGWGKSTFFHTDSKEFIPFLHNIHQNYGFHKYRGGNILTFASKTYLWLKVGWEIYMFRICFVSVSFTFDLTTMLTFNTNVVTFLPSFWASRKTFSRVSILHVAACITVSGQRFAT